MRFQYFAIKKISTIRATAIRLALVPSNYARIKSFRSKREDIVYRLGNETILFNLCCYLSAMNTGNGLKFARTRNPFTNENLYRNTKYNQRRARSHATFRSHL